MKTRILKIFSLPVIFSLLTLNYALGAESIQTKNPTSSKIAQKLTLGETKATYSRVGNMKSVNEVRLSAVPNASIEITKKFDPCPLTSEEKVEEVDGTSIIIKVYACSDGTEKTVTEKYDDCGNLSEKNENYQYNGCGAPEYVNVITQENGSKEVVKFFKCGNGEQKEVTEYYDANEKLKGKRTETAHCGGGSVTTRYETIYDSLF